MRPIAPLVLAGLLPVLVACSGPEPDATPPVEPPPDPSPPVLAGVDLAQSVNALGTEPFWSVRIRPAGIEYDGVDRPLKAGANPGPTVTGDTAVWATALADGTALVVTLAAGDCSDGMSDRTYPLSAQVEVGTETLTGCAASQSFIETTGEDGRPRN